MSYRYGRPARTRRAAVILAATWLAVVAAWIAFEMAPWIVAALLTFTLPAAWDFANGRVAWLTLDDTHLRWKSGRHEGEVALARIAHIRLETRLDLSHRARIVLEGGRRLTIPQDSTPPLAELQPALDAAGVAHQRHHFSLM